MIYNECSLQQPENEQKETLNLGLDFCKLNVVIMSTISATQTNITFTNIRNVFGDTDNITTISMSDYIADGQNVSAFTPSVSSSLSNVNVGGFRGTQHIPQNLAGITTTNLVAYYDVSLLHCYNAGVSTSQIKNLSRKGPSPATFNGTVGTAFANASDGIVSLSATNFNWIQSDYIVNTSDCNMFVYEGWFKIPSPPTQNTYIMANLPSNGSTTTPLTVLYVNSTCNLTLWERNTANVSSNLTAYINVCDNAWHHLVVNGTATTMDLYDNGTLVSSLTRPGGTTSNSHFKVSGTLGRYITMQVGPVRLYEGGTLTTPQINTHYYLERYKLTNTYYDMDFLYTNAGTYVFTVPEGITALSVLCIGGGGGGARGDPAINSGGAGGGCTWVNKIPVTAGTRYRVVVGNGGTRTANNQNANNGGDTKFMLYSDPDNVYILAGGGEGGKYNTSVDSAGGVGGTDYIRGYPLVILMNSGGGFGGDGRRADSTAFAAGGGGAGGYFGSGGFGAGNTSGSGSSATGSSGGNGTTNGNASGGGGAGLYGFIGTAASQTDPGSAYSGSRGDPNYAGPAPYNFATSGSPGLNGDGSGGLFGGGSGSCRTTETPGNGGRGAVRIICHHAGSTNNGFQTTAGALAATIATFVNGLTLV